MIARIAAIMALAGAALAAAAAAAATTPGELRLVPYPRTVTAGTGTFPLRGELRIAVPRGNEEDAFAAGMLKEEIEARSPARARVVEGGDGEIVLARDGALADAGEEGYRLEV
jgi:hypothetical protein